MKMEGCSKIKWAMYLTLASLFIFVSVSEVGPLSSVKMPVFSSSSVVEDIPKYVIIFDGGSTGTRIHVFSFVNSSSGLLTIKDGYFAEVTPGLSSFALKPKKAAVSVFSLLEKAKAFVPPESWDDTPVALKATAGLRLLPSHLSESILQEVSKALRNSPFLSGENSVSVLDGEDEGLFAWYTLNFLLERLNEPSRSVAALDLGGGSTQVTFSPIDLDTIVFSPKGYIISRKVQNKTMPIYTHSYLGLGLMSARLSILKISGEKKVVSNDEKPVSFTSSCIYPDSEIVWNHDGNEYSVRGRTDGKYGFKSCYEKAVEFLGDAVDQPEELGKRDVYALSYYFDRSLDLGIINEAGGVITVGRLMDACKDRCSLNSLGNSFLCLDCTYISALLHHGLGFNKKKEIKLVKQIHGIDASWGLGAAFNMILTS